MKHITRRSFLTTATASGSAAFLGTSCASEDKAASSKGLGKRSHPLEGIERENIKITDVRVTPISYEDPKGNLWRSGNYIVWKTDGCLTEVFTDQGIVGIGEGSPYAGPDRIKKYTDEFITPTLIGKNPFDIELLTCGDADRWTGRCPWAGVDNALWDIIGKAKNMPVYKLLATDNKPDPHILLYASGGDYHEWHKNGEEVLIEEALGYKEEGYIGMKFRTGTNWEYGKMTLKKYIPILQRLREAVGPDFRLMHETMNATGVTMKEIINVFCPAIDELDFYWFERFGDIESNVRVNEALSKVMVSSGEIFKTRFEAKQWIDRKAIDIIQSDCNVTGITENWYISRIAHLNGMPHCPHNWHGGLTTMANAHFHAGIPNRHMLELNQTYNPLLEGVFKEPYVVENGYMDLPDKPGFGVEVIDDIEKKFPWVPGSYSKPNPLFPQR